MTRKKPRATPGPFSALVLRPLKQEVNRKAGDLIENDLKPEHVEPPPTDHQLNYVTEITAKMAYLEDSIFRFRKQKGAPIPLCVCPGHEQPASSGRALATRSRHPRIQSCA
jgi:hypothetical protein